MGDWQLDRSDLRSSGGTGDMGAATGMAILGCVRYVVRRLRPFEKTCMENGKSCCFGFANSAQQPLRRQPRQ